MSKRNLDKKIDLKDPKTFKRRIFMKRKNVFCNYTYLSTCSSFGFLFIRNVFCNGLLRRGLQVVTKFRRLCAKEQFSAFCCANTPCFLSRKKLNTM